jgi:hypothetical protein
MPNFTQREWRRIFTRYDRVVFIPGALADNAQLKAARHRTGAVAGWLRNERAIKKLWARSHEATELLVQDLKGWVLNPKH